MLQVLLGGPQKVLDFLAVDLDERHVHLVHPTLVFHLLLRLGDLSDRVGVKVRVKVRVRVRVRVRVKCVIGML